MNATKSAAEAKVRKAAMAAKAANAAEAWWTFRADKCYCRLQGHTHQDRCEASAWVAHSAYVFRLGRLRPSAFNHMKPLEPSGTMIIRLSQKLAAKIKAGKLTHEPLSENECADWSAHLFTFGRTQYIILCNTKSLYCCFMYGKGITNEEAFLDRALSTIRAFMEADEQLNAYQKFIAPSSASVTFAKALSRSVTGSMNDHIQGAKILLEVEFTPYALGFRLNQTPLSALKGKDGYANPNEAFKLLQGEV